MHVTDIVVSWKLGSNCIVCIETGWCCVCGFRVNSLKFICTICLVVCKHIRSGCNRFRNAKSVARSRGKVTRGWTASIFRNVIFVLTELLHVYFGRSNVVFAILFCFVQNKFVSVKPLWGFILVSSETMFWLLSFSEKQHVFDCVVVLKCLRN